VPGLRDRLTDAGYGLGWSVVCRLPESWPQRGFRFAADRAWRRQSPGVRPAGYGQLRPGWRMGHRQGGRVGYDRGGAGEAGAIILPDKPRLRGIPASGAERS
jgi:hypothetical protein